MSEPFDSLIVRAFCHEPVEWSGFKGFLENGGYFMNSPSSFSSTRLRSATSSYVELLRTVFALCNQSKYIIKVQSFEKMAKPDEAPISPFTKLGRRLAVHR